MTKFIIFVLIILLGGCCMKKLTSSQEIKRSDGGGSGIAGRVGGRGSTVYKEIEIQKGWFVTAH